MSNENALFEEEFDLGDDSFGSDDLVGQLTGSREEADTGARVELPPMEAYEGGDRAIPAISVLAFCETKRVSSIIDRVQMDRRMANATVRIIPGGIPAAIEHLAEHPTPNLLIVESSAPSSEMIGQIDQLAGLCEEGVEVMVVGATNDIALYRQLVARGVSEYLVPPIEPVQMVRSIANIFNDPDAPFVGKSISVVGAKGGVGASTIAHNLAWSLAENARVSTSLVDLDLSFGTTSLDFNHETPQTVADASSRDFLPRQPTGFRSLPRLPASTRSWTSTRKPIRPSSKACAGSCRT